MENNELIPIETDDNQFDDKIYGVKIERRKRRHRKKKQRNKLFILVFLISITSVIICYYSDIGSFFKSFFEHDTLSPITSDSSLADSTTSSNSQDDSNGDYVDDIPDDFPIRNTTPDKFTTVYEFAGDFDMGSISFPITKKEELYNQYGNDAPIVLLVCFSPSKCYSNGKGYSYSSNFNCESDNVADLSAAICNKLNSLGINTVYLENEEKRESTLYEQQKEYEEKINAFLDKTPSILYIFDISRALTFNKDMSLDKEMVTIDNMSLPTINFVCGTNNGSLSSIQKEGAFLSNELSKFFNCSYPLFVSKQTISRFELSQRFNVPCIRVEIGSYSHTFEDALSSAMLFSQLLSIFLS